MRLPPLTSEELTPFLTQGRWVATLATHNPDGSIRMTPLTYAVDEDSAIVFSTWHNSAAVRNVRRDGRVSVLIDKVDQPYAGVHYTGQAEAEPETYTPQEYARRFGRYVGDTDQAAQSDKILTSLGLGDRATIRFRPTTTVTWDFGKIPAG
jgi:PPOX class probable F420-dependent enzyme